MNILLAINNLSLQKSYELENNLQFPLFCFMVKEVVNNEKKSVVYISIGFYTAV